jgi:pilus assembly protein Flp/PilA
MSNFIAAVKTFATDENGVTAIEYGLIAALIGVGVATTAGLLGTAVGEAFKNITKTINDALKPA